MWNRYIASHPFDYELRHQGLGAYIMRAWETEPIPADFAVEMGVAASLNGCRQVLEPTEPLGQSAHMKQRLSRLAKDFAHYWKGEC